MDLTNNSHWFSFHWLLGGLRTTGWRSWEFHIAYGLGNVQDVAYSSYEVANSWSVRIRGADDTRRHCRMMTSSNENIFALLAIHRSQVNSAHKDQRRGAVMFYLICAPLKDWVNNREKGDLRRHGAHYYVTVMNDNEDGGCTALSLGDTQSNSVLPVGNVNFTFVMCSAFILSTVTIDNISSPDPYCLWL